MSLFDSLEPLPPLRKFQLLECYLADPRPHKILAATGAYKNQRARTPVFECVRSADHRIRSREPIPDYLEPAGYLPFRESMQRLLFAADFQPTDGEAPLGESCLYPHFTCSQPPASAIVSGEPGTSVPGWRFTRRVGTSSTGNLHSRLARNLKDVGKDKLDESHIRTIHTPGGTSALRVGADLLNAACPGKTVRVSDPTWGNHLKVFEAAGLSVETYPYTVRNGVLDVDQLLASIEAIPEGDVLMLQASSHNPTSVDLRFEDWQQLAAVIARRNLIPFFDAAFFGFTEGLRQDLAGMRTILATGCEAIVVTSLSKSFALYNRRVGTLSIIGETDAAAETAFQRARHLIRTSYSNPPLEGAAVVAEILSHRPLFSIWERELEQVRARMSHCREDIVRLLREYGVERDLAYLTRERGLFSHFDLTSEQIETLRHAEGIYLSPSGSFNVTAIADEQRDRFCRCVSVSLK